ncbi:GNAT family N-acetyltransferase [Solibacillus sp. A46]|uniref:GNAT family N-acetyltransferase n=1 Tax=Solibacillus faecavium TaxID=2762221 RepID=A0ABR8Y2X3_9BACL|nr:GNAT family N-acetyltransferase [Solibacillus faecavium]MBD8038567.1 GNAT family N-acetyltransferase [Solibacillus faecavium]
MKNINQLLEEHSELKSERLFLRPISLEDAEDMYEYMADEETVKFLFEPHKELTQTKKMIDNYFLKEPLGKYALVLKESNKMIGAIEFRVHEWNKSGELGFTMNRNFWGKGYMNEAGNLILNLAFNTLGLERVFSESDTRNAASSKLMSRLGMTHEGTMRKNHMIRGTLVDSVYYSILKEEYQQA